MHTTVVLPQAKVVLVKKNIASLSNESPRAFALKVAKRAFRLFASRKRMDAQVYLEEAVRKNPDCKTQLELALSRVVNDMSASIGDDKLCTFNPFLDLCFDADLQVDLGRHYVV